MRQLLQRIFAVLIMTALCFSIPAAAGDTSYDGDKNFTYFEILTKLGVLTEFIAEKNPEAAITRGEFSYLLAGGFSYPVTGTQRYFSDVDSSREYAGAVMSLYEAGIVTGASDAAFHPDTDISLADASVMAVRALGYVPMANQSGGYPSGYQITAMKIGLLNGVNQSSKLLSVSDAVRLVFNALTADRMELLSYGGEETYAVKKDSNVLMQFYNLYYARGIVEKNEITSLDAPSGYDLPYVQVGGVKYADPERLGQSLLGYHADVLYRQNDDGTREIFLIYASSENNTLRIDAEDIVGNTTETLTYEVDEKEHKVTVNFNAAIIYNGIAAPTINAMGFIPTYGDILLVDNNQDNRYDTVFVNEYQTYVAYAVAEDTILDIDGNPIDLTVYEKDPLIYKDGKLISLADIAPYDVISLCASRNNEAATLYVTSEQAVGVFSELYDENCVIGEKSYQLSAPLLTSIANGSFTLPPMGDEVRAYIDVKGNIVYFKEALFNGMKYGYVLGLVDGQNKLKDTVLRVIDHLGQVDDLLLEKNVLYNQTYHYDVATLLPLLKESDGSAKHQLIKYKTGAKNRLTEISLEETDTAITDEKRLVLTNDYTQASSKPTWWRAGMIFHFGSDLRDWQALTAESVVFSVPTDAADRTDASKYKVSNYSILQTDASYGFKAYDVGDAGVVNVILLEGTNGVSFDPKGGISVISDIKTVLNEKEEIVLSVSYMLAGAMKTALTDAEISYGPINRSPTSVSWDGMPGIEIDALKNPDTGIGEGDVVMLNFSAEGTINGIFKFADASKAPDMMDGLKNPSADAFYPRVTYGKVSAINDTIYTVQPEGKTIQVPYTTANTSTRYVYVDLNASDITPVKVTVDYLKRCNGNEDYRVLTRCTNNASVIDCIIYKLKTN